MDPIRLIRSPAELRGTCYFEFLPGEYAGRCWNEGSVFLAEGTFGLIEPIIARREPCFDHYAFVAIPRATWALICADLDRLAARAEVATGLGDLDEHFGYAWSRTRREFGADFRANAAQSAALARDLAAWLGDQLESHECVSVLGM